MLKPFIRIKRGLEYRGDYLEFGNGETSWTKNLVELTSYIGVSKSEEDKIKFKKMYCESVSECMGIPFTIEEFDKIVTKKDYQLGMHAFGEYKHIVETNIKDFEQGREPTYMATSIGGSKLMKILSEKSKELKDA